MNIEKIFLRPAVVGGQTLKVRKPVGGYLAERGESVVQDSYWRRRLKDGDVVEAKEPAVVVPAPTGAQTADTQGTAAASATDGVAKSGKK